MKLYKGYTRAQLIDILADYAVFTATINNDHGGAPQNTNKGDYVGLYSTYPMNSRKYPAFSLSVMFDRMNVDIARAAEIASAKVWWFDVQQAPPHNPDGPHPLPQVLRAL